MAFRKGEPRPPNAGRRRGTPNKAPPMKSLRESLSVQGFDLGQELVNLIRDPNTDQSTRLKALQTIAQYTQTIPREDASSDTDNSLEQLSNDELSDLIKTLNEPTASPPTSSETPTAESPASALA